MNGIETKKIQIVQDVLALQDEQELQKIEFLLEKIKLQKKQLTPMPIEEFYKRINQSEQDFLNEQYVEMDDLIEKYK